jgi:predicted permease
MFQTTLLVVLPLFFVIALGYLAGRRQLLDAHQAAGVNRILVEFALPAALFTGTVQTPRAALLQLAPLVTALLAIYATFWLLGNGLARGFFGHSSGAAVIQATTVAFPNTGFMGVPILGGLFGASSVVSVAIATVLGTLTFIPVAIMLLEMERGKHADGTPKHWREVLAPAFLNAARAPLTWAPLLAAALVLLNVQVPPEILAMLNLIGGVTAGLAMFAAGLTLAMFPLRVNAEIVVNAFVKMILQPAAMLLLVRAMGMSSPLDAQAVILTALPTPVLATILATRYHVYRFEATSTFVFSSLCLLVTLPLWMLVLGQ